MTSDKLGTGHEQTHRGRIALLVALISAEFYVSLEATMIYTALPAIVREFGDIKTSGWLIGIYVLMQAATAAIGGRLGDVFGRRRVILMALAIAALGSFVSAFSHSLLGVITGRALQGVGGVILPLALGIVRDAVSRDQRSLWVGLLTGAYTLSGVIGFALGGVLTEWASWRWIFWVTAVLPIFIGPLIFACVPADKPSARGSLNYWGLVFAPGIGALLLAVNGGSDWGWRSFATWGVLTLGILMLAVWARSELHHANPLIDVRLLGVRQLALANGLAFLIGLGGFQLPLVLNMLLQQPPWTGVGLGLSAAIAGLWKIPSNISSGVAAACAGQFSRRTGVRATAIVGAALLVGTWGSLIFWHDALWMVVMAMCIGSAGMALVLTAVSLLALDTAPADRSSEAVGVTSVSRAVGMAAGALIVSTMLASSVTSGNDAASYPHEVSYVLVFAFIAIVSSGALACGLMLNPGSSRRFDGKSPT